MHGFEMMKSKPYQRICSIRDDSEALREVMSRCSDERWPVRIMMCFTKALIENTSLYKDNKNVIEWFDSFRDSDPDPTEP
jgi:hypothetical protein